MIYEHLWMNSLAFASLCRWLFCQDSRSPGCMRKSRPAMWAKDNVLFECLGFRFFPLLLRQKVRNQATSIALVFVSTFSSGEIWGLQKLGVVINYLVMKAIILVKTASALAESRSLPIFPCKALSHMIRSWSGCGWLRGKRLQSHWMNISKWEHSYSRRVMASLLDGDTAKGHWYQNWFPMRNDCESLNFQTMFAKTQWVISLLCLAALHTQLSISWFKAQSIDASLSHKGISVWDIVSGLITLLNRHEPWKR